MEKIRLGLMSPGTWGRTILDALRDSDNAEIVACASRSRETAVKAAQEYGIAVADSYESLLGEDIHGVILPTPHRLHHEQVISAAEAGKHVFVEKPIANTIVEAKEMQAACEKAGICLMVGHSQRRMPGCRTAKRMIESGTYGPPLNAVAYVGMKGVEYYSPGHWLLDGVENPGGSLYMMGVHFTDTLQYIMGPIEKASAFEIRGFAGTTIPEVVSGVFRFKEPRLGYLGSHYVAPYNSFITIYCEKAIFYIDKFGRELFFQDSPFPKIERRAVKLDPTPFASPVREEIEEFAECIRGKRKPETGAEEAIRALAAIRALMVSAAEGRQIAIDEIIEKY